MKFPLDWLRHWRLLSSFRSAWDDLLYSLRPRHRDLFTRCRPQLEPLEIRLAPTTSPTGTAFVALTRQAATVTVGSFTPESGTTPSSYHVNILWGDGQSSTGSVDSSYNVTGTHTYNAAGAYAVAFQVENSLALTTAVGESLGLVESLFNGANDLRPDLHSLVEGGQVSLGQQGVRLAGDDTPFGAVPAEGTPFCQNGSIFELAICRVA